MIGIESGDDEVLAHVNKGYTAADVVEQCGKLDDVGLLYNCIYLGGIAGAGHAEETAARSAEVFNRIRPQFMYLTTVTIFPDSELGAEVARGDFAPMSELERFREFRALVAALENPIVVDTCLATNSIGFVAELPADRDECLAALDEAIAGFSEDDERRLSRRRAMMRTI